MDGNPLRPQKIESDGEAEELGRIRRQFTRIEDQAKGRLVELLGGEQLLERM